MMHLLLFVGFFVCSSSANPIESKQVQPVSNIIHTSGVSHGNRVRQDEDDDSEVEFNTGTPLITEIIDLGIAAGMKLLNITTPGPPVQATQPSTFLQSQNPYILPGAPQAPQVVAPQQPQIIFVPVTVTASPVETQTSGTTEAEDDDDDSEP